MVNDVSDHSSSATANSALRLLNLPPARTQLLETTPAEVTDLFQRLDESRLRYVVVDTIEQHVVNTRLFVYPPSISPAHGRWQVFSLIG